MKKKNNIIMYALAGTLLLAVMYYLIPECGDNQTLVRGLFWFECVAK